MGFRVRSFGQSQKRLIFHWCLHLLSFCAGPMTTGSNFYLIGCVRIVVYRTLLVCVCADALWVARSYRSLTLRVQICDVIQASRFCGCGYVLLTVMVWFSSSLRTRWLFRIQRSIVCVILYYGPFSFTCTLLSLLHFFSFLRHCYLFRILVVLLLKFRHWSQSLLHSQIWSRALSCPPTIVVGYNIRAAINHSVVEMVRSGPSAEAFCNRCQSSRWPYGLFIRTSLPPSGDSAAAPVTLPDNIAKLGFFFDASRFAARHWKGDTVKFVDASLHDHDTSLGVWRSRWQLFYRKRAIFAESSEAKLNMPYNRCPKRSV